MKNYASAVSLFLATTPAWAHAGHGKPGFLHSHELSDGLLVVALLVAVALTVCAWKK